MKHISDWVVEEVQGVNFGDKRLNERCIDILNQLCLFKNTHQVKKRDELDQYYGDKIYNLDFGQNNLAYIQQLIIYLLYKIIYIKL